MNADLLREVHWCVLNYENKLKRLNDFIKNVTLKQFG